MQRQLEIILLHYDFSIIWRLLDDYNKWNHMKIATLKILIFRDRLFKYFNIKMIL